MVFDHWAATISNANTAQTPFFSTHVVGAIPAIPAIPVWALEAIQVQCLGVFPGIDKIIPVIYGNTWKEQTKTLTSYCGVILI